MGVSHVGKFIYDCSDDILWIILIARAQKKKNKEELENEMLEYFRK